MAGSNQEVGFLRVMLSSGQSVDVLTQPGADAFLTSGGEGPSNFIRANLETVNQARETLRRERVSAARKRELQERMVGTYCLLGCVASNASPHVFEDYVSLPDLEAFMDHARSVFSALTDADAWKKTGVLAKHDQELLEDLISLNKHARVTTLMLSRTENSSKPPLMQVLAKLCAARSKPRMFGAPVAEAVLAIVNNVQISLQRQGYETNKTFRYLEDTGILAQVFRAFTVPPVHPEELPRSVQLLDFLSLCEKLVRKKLQPGTPTGDVLDDVLQGRDGHLPVSKRPDIVVQRLKNLQRAAAMSNEDISHGHVDTHFCRLCNKTGLDLGDTKLMKCAKCKNTYYCSRECQVADWKSHKKTCQQGMTSSKGHQSMVCSFVHQNYYAIMTQLVAQMRQRHLPKSEFNVEIDFYKEIGESSSPALKNQFRIVVTKEILEGSRSAEPDWFYRGTDVYEKNVVGFLEGARDHYKRLTTNHLLCIVRSADGNPGIYRLQLFSEDTGQSIVSDDAVDAFTRWDDTAMRRIYGASQTNYLERCKAHDLRRRMQDLGLEENGDTFNAIAQVAQRAREFMQTEEWQRMHEEFGSDDEDEDDDVDDVD